MKGLQKGFTLIELMIVIAIIAILAAILIPNFLHARAESQTSACEGNEKQIATTLEEYAVDHSGQYPAAAGAVNPALFGAVPNAYMAAQPFDPIASNAYNYAVAPNKCPAAAGGQFYEIDDGGGHDPTVQIANGTLGQTSVIYCAGSGLSGA